MGHPLKLPSSEKLARQGHFRPVSQAGRLAVPVFYDVFSLEIHDGLKVPGCGTLWEGDDPWFVGAAGCAARAARYRCDSAKRKKRRLERVKGIVSRDKYFLRRYFYLNQIFLSER